MGLSVFLARVNISVVERHHFSAIDSIEYLVEVPHAMNSSCVKGSEDPAPSRRRLLESAACFPSDCATIRLHVSPSAIALPFRSTRGQRGGLTLA
jgi:hypothetical protein